MLEDLIFAACVGLAKVGAHRAALARGACSPRAGVTGEQPLQLSPQLVLNRNPASSSVPLLPFTSWERERRVCASGLNVGRARGSAAGFGGRCPLPESAAFLPAAWEMDFP